MDEVTKIDEIVVEEPVGEPTAREELETLLNEILPEEKRTGDVEQMALDYIREQVASNDRIAEAIAEDPRLAQVFAEVSAGTRKPGVALARYFGKNLLTAEEGSPEYDELIAADEEYFNERNAMKAAKAENDAKMAEFFDWLEDELKDETGAEGDMLKRVYEEILVPLLDGVKDKNLPNKLKKGLIYDKDVEDAFEAGEVKGRNTSIHEMKGKIGDGMPKALSSQGVMETPKRKINPLLAKALQA